MSPGFGMARPAPAMWNGPWPIAARDDVRELVPEDGCG